MYDEIVLTLEGRTVERPDLRHRSLPDVSKWVTPTGKYCIGLVG